MDKTTVNLNSFMLIGISTRTNNKKEMNQDTSKIGAMMKSYWSYQIANDFKYRVNPGVTYAVYTDYESDEHGDYTYFIGEEVSTLENQDMTTFTSLIVPESRYQRFTTAAGAMSEVIIRAWQGIWQMTLSMLEGKRKYKADFERYDQRAIDPNNAIVDIYIGIE
jgi:predicted transcriptional regulator YdeE